MATKKMLSAEKLDALHDAGVDMSDYIDYASATRPGLEIQRVNVDFPKWMVESLDREAERRGVSRQAVIKYCISERLDAAKLAEDSARYGKKSR